MLNSWRGYGSRSIEGAGWSVTIDAGKLQVLICARYFLAGALIGAALWLPVFLAMG